MVVNKKQEIEDFRANKLTFYVDYVEENRNNTKDLLELKLLKRRARELKVEIENLEHSLEYKEKALEEVLDKIDYLKQNHVKKC